MPSSPYQMGWLTPQGLNESQATVTWPISSYSTSRGSRASAGGSAKVCARVSPPSTRDRIANRIHPLRFRRHAGVCLRRYLMAGPAAVGGVSKFMRSATWRNSHTLPVSPSVSETTSRCSGALANAASLNTARGSRNSIIRTGVQVLQRHPSPERPGWAFTFNYDYVRI